MSNNDVMLQAEQRQADKQVPQFEIGDTVDVQVRITEGDKSRIQLFSGIVIAKKHGGLRESFTVRRLVDGEGVERTFPIHSPAVVGITVKRHGVTRRAKLYFLRERVGKATRLKERKVVKKEAEAAEAASAKKGGRKRGAKAKAERRQRAAEAPKPKKSKKKKKAEAKA